MKKKILFTVLAIAAALAVMAPGGGNSGAIWTTNGGCGPEQNVNHYPSGSHVWINGSGFDPNTTLNWNIQTPGANGTDVVPPGTVVTDGNGDFCVDAGVPPDGGPYQVNAGGKNDNLSIDAAPPACDNGATNYPACDNICLNGATNYPACNNNVCSNGATNYPACDNVCLNGATNYPACDNNLCTNGATNYPDCNNQCTNGATNPPACNNNVCLNGATNWPTCDNNVCLNGATNWPTCDNVCNNGATNYPTCDNNSVCDDPQAQNYGQVGACIPPVKQTCEQGFLYCDDEGCACKRPYWPACNSVKNEPCLRYWDRHGGESRIEILLLLRQQDPGAARNYLYYLNEADRNAARN